MSRVLLHVCCGACAIHPVRVLRAEDMEVEGFFYNPNIHPYSEYLRRLEAVLEAGRRLDVIITAHKYDFEEFLRSIVDCDDRCEHHSRCWHMRLEETARAAKEKCFDAFTTTLLISPYQDIATIARQGEEIAGRYGVSFLARNFRRGFADSHRVSREWGLYHQNYCGCLYSEKEAIEGRQRRAAKSDAAVEPI